MIESKEKSIQDDKGKSHKYQVTQFAAMRGLRMATRLVQLVGPGVGEAMDLARSGGLAKLMDADIDLSAVVKELVGQLDEDKVLNLVTDLLSSTHRDGQDMSQETVFNDAYAANYGELFRALVFVLEVNYGNFLGALRAANPGGKATGSAVTQDRSPAS